jgi:hypothetical protein
MNVFNDHCFGKKLKINEALLIYTGSEISADGSWAHTGMSDSNSHPMPL